MLLENQTAVIGDVTNARSQIGRKACRSLSFAHSWSIGDRGTTGGFR
jgi:hypothetical protein